jgi:hypothetical protein
MGEGPLGTRGRTGKGEKVKRAGAKVQRDTSQEIGKRSAPNAQDWGVKTPFDILFSIVIFYSSFPILTHSYPVLSGRLESVVQWKHGLGPEPDTGWPGPPSEEAEMESLAGSWEERIYDSRGNVIKRDIITLNQEGDQITGDIQRIAPGEQSQRRWKLAGKVIGRDFLAIFWSENPDVVSHGCWHLQYTSDSLFTGYYLKAGKGDLSAASAVRIDLVRV